MRYAEVIGDPIAQSKSPIIHKYWLDQLNINGDYCRTLVPPDALAAFLERRRGDPDWLGCNVTIPHKESAARLVDDVDPTAQAVGATNCILPRQRGLWATNTDVDGVAAALDGVPVEGRKVVILGGGGGARATIAYLASRGAEVLVLVRSPERAEPLKILGDIEIGAVNSAGTLLEGAVAIINASPLGMKGSPEMPSDLLEAVARHSSGVTLFDMVYNPLETQFLATGRAAGASVIDGLTMLLGQAARVFELFFGTEAPPVDQQLRKLLGYNSDPEH